MQFTIYRLEIQVELMNYAGQVEPIRIPKK